MSLISSIKKYVCKDGSEKRTKRIKYKCMSKFQHHDCDGQTTYSASKLDNEVIKVIMNAFQSNEINILESAIHQQFNVEIKTIENNILDTKYQLRQQEENLADLKNEVINVVRGTSAFGSILLNQLIDKCENTILSLENKLNGQNIDLQNRVNDMQTFETRYNNLAEVCSSLDLLSLDEKQKVTHQHIRRIYVGSDYQINIDWLFSS